MPTVTIQQRLKTLGYILSEPWPARPNLPPDVDELTGTLLGYEDDQGGGLIWSVLEDIESVNRRLRPGEPRVADTTDRQAILARLHPLIDGDRLLVGDHGAIWNGKVELDLEIGKKGIRGIEGKIQSIFGRRVNGFQRGLSPSFWAKMFLMPSLSFRNEPHRAILYPVH